MGLNIKPGPEPLPGSCGDGTDAVCKLIVNLTEIGELWSNSTSSMAVEGGYTLEVGPVWEQNVARGTQWFTFILSVFMTVWFFYNAFTGHCGWEVIYVTIVEFLKIVIEIFYEWYTPCMIYSVFGAATPWLRYMEWLLTCPTILIHLSNITGLDEEYSPRTMSLLTSDQGTIVFGMTAAFSTIGWSKILLFLCGLGFGINTFYTASRVYIESFHSVPKGICRNLVKYMSGMFFASWMMFPLLFLAGPEGTGFLSWSGTTIGHTIADLLSKNLWGLLGHYLQVRIRQHILEHGDIRKTVEKTVGGQTFEVEEYVTKDDEDGQEVEDSKLDRRRSFQLIGAQMAAKGMDVRLNNNSKAEDEDFDMDHQKMMNGQMQPMMAQMGSMGAIPTQPQMAMQMQPMMAAQSMNGQQAMDPMQQQMLMLQMQQQQMMAQQAAMQAGMPQQNAMMMGGTTPTGQLSPGQMSPGGSMYGGQMGMMMQQPGNQM